MGEGDPIRLNLGCGHKLMEGFINIDMPNNWSDTKPDVEADVTNLGYPDRYADEIHAYHVFEHFYRFEAEKILADWVRMLKPGGRLVLELPCLDKILLIFDYYALKGKPINPALTTFALYGDPRYESIPMCHKWCYSKLELTTLMENAGLTVVETKPETHYPVRDMRLEGTKCTLLN